MKFETFKQLYQRSSTIFILILSFWLVYNAYLIQDYSYSTINVFFKNYYNVFFFVILILLSFLHSSIEIFHAIDDYFSETKNEIIIKNLTKFLILLFALSILIFLIKYSFL